MSASSQPYASGQPHRGSPLWIIGRIGILICFGIMPLVQVCHRIKTEPLRAAQRKCAEAYQRCNQYAVLSEGWATNKAAGDYWRGEAQRLYKEIYGK